MASIANDPGGRRRILFVAPDGSRKAIRLGRASQRAAESVCRHVEGLLAARIAGQPLSRDTALWLAELGEPLRSRLVRVGLIETVDPAASPQLGAFLTDYLDRQTHVKPASLLAVRQAVRNLLDYFGPQTRLTDITPGRADDFRKWLLSDGRSHRQPNRPRKLAPATAGRRLGYVAGFFEDARKRRLIAENPFGGMKRPPAHNPERQAYVPAEVVEALIDIAGSAEWRLLLALARYLGLRVPSEPFSLTWDCVDWERGRLRVPSPKTAVHGKAYRVVPILPQVRPHLEEVWQSAPEGSTHVFSRLRERHSIKAVERGYWRALNLRTHLLRLIARAGLRPWPRLWHNLRSSAQTDLANRFPAHVVCDWLGNNRQVALAHYLQVTDEHYALAIEGELMVNGCSQEAAQKAAQNPAQQGAASKRMYTQQEYSIPSKSAEKPHRAICRKSLQDNKFGPAGFEPATKEL